MQPYDSNTIAALNAGGLIKRELVTIRGKDLSDTPVQFNFWSGEVDVTVSVVSGVDRTTESRNYVGGGSLLSVDPLPLVLGLETRTINVTLSQIHSSVQSMVRGNNIRHAVAEVHRGLFSISTGQIVSTPYPRFFGKVDGAPIETPAAGQEGSITLSLVSNTVELTRINPALKSDASQSLRSGDRFRRYADASGQVDVWWGEAQSGTPA